MSLEGKKEITDRVWQHSQARSLGKMLLLALVEHADDDGFCYPSHETLGRMIGLGLEGKGKAKAVQKNTQHHLAPLIESGELMYWKQQGKRGGRGNTNIYLITVGLTNEQTRERIKRRFKLFDDEVNAALTRTGEVFERLCADAKIAADMLDLTRPSDDKKGGKFGDNPEQKPPKTAPHSQGDDKKGGKFGGGTKESLKQKPNPNKESKDSSPFQKMFVTLAELCRINLKSASEKQKGQLGTAAKVLVSLVTDVDQFKDKFKLYWAKMDWRGKQDQPPTPPQIQEVYGDYCYWLEHGQSLGRNGVSNGTHQRANRRNEPTGQQLKDKPTFNPITGELVKPSG